MSNRKRVSLYIMNMVDIVSLLIAFVISYEIRKILPMWRVFTRESIIAGYRFQQFPYMPLLFATIISYILVNFLFLYSEEYLSRNVSSELLATLRMIVMVIVVDVVILFITKTSERYSRIFMVIFFIIAYFTCFILREAVKKIYIPRYKNGKASEKMVLVCRERDTDRVLEQLNAIIDWRFHISGLVIIDADLAGEYISGIRVISNYSDAMANIQKEEVDSILLVSGDPEEERAWVRHFQPLGKTVHVSLPEFELSDTKRMQDMLGQCAVVSYLPEIPIRGRNVVIKRSLDIIVSILLLPFVLAVMMIVTLLTKIFLKGPVFVTRVRVGMNGRRFNQYHFRVYRMDSDQRKTEGRSCFTWLGRFLDLTHLDGLPQVLNVLVGDMSFVGPRAPSLPYFIENPGELRYLCTKPGLVGTWCTDRRSGRAEKDRYLNNWSLGLDAEIIFIMIIRYLTFRSARSRQTMWEPEECAFIREYMDFRKPLEYDHSTYTCRMTAGKRVYYFIKRLFDIVGSLLGIILLSPLLLILMFAVMADDGGNPFYGHSRIGKNGKKITVYKFRSMRRDAGDLEKILTPEQLEQYRTEFKIDNDPRITKVGNFIRRTSLDELPQLFNILSGDLSIVGPRPIVEKETTIYGRDVAKLLSVKPGLTGYWQAYARNNATYESGERQKMEMYYVDHQSLGLDVKILFRTVKSVTKEEGAQ
ncbi:MAG: sugar transferase [Bilifractor sp.]|nr:sugar transferase [Bilifractor sp.]